MVKRKTIPLILMVVGCFFSTYFAWALHRTTGNVLVHDKSWPRHWPYPDEWIAGWNDELDRAHPIAPGLIKIHGEIPRIQFYLSSYIVISLLVAFIGLSWLFFLKRRQSKIERT